jgi:hypothetical protein
VGFNHRVQTLRKGLVIREFPQQGHPILQLGALVGFAHLFLVVGDDLDKTTDDVREESHPTEHKSDS